MNTKQRQIKLRLAWFKHFQEKSHNVARTCRYFGISRYTFYFWLKRYKNKGVEGLYDLSRKPKTSPRSTSDQIINKIIKLRKGRGLGPVKISRRLLKKYNIKISHKTVYLILKKAKLNKLSKQL
ncbi:MAG: helix-turn-helix domain containing protein [Candidatus Yanofskybacteria bacterium]|nr:helix-turn-helix domain containing protein [Candidatus Yanofskybacteria bacterium]